MVGNFIDALTRGGTPEHPVPMEHHAHDPQRYVGDMLAWLSQALPVEKENLFILVKLCDKSGIIFYISIFYPQLKKYITYHKHIGHSTLGFFHFQYNYISYILKFQCKNNTLKFTYF